MIPDYTIQALQRYAENHLPPGDFLEALLKGQVDLAYHVADANNKLALKEIALFIETNLPAESFGTQEKVEAWLVAKIEPYHSNATGTVDW